MEAVSVTRKKSFFDHFSIIQDPRVNRNIKHNLLDIIAMAICVVIANANDWNEIEAWAF